MLIPLSRPDIAEVDIEAVVSVLRTPFLSNGPRVKEFEHSLAQYIGIKHAVAVHSGTSGLHLLVRAFSLHDGDEVLTTPFSFVASSNCLLYERAKPVFVDIDPLTLNMDPDRAAAAVTPRTKAILPVHVFGHPAEMDPLLELAQTRGLKVIEDACEALGAEYRGRKAGTLGDAGVFAFYPNKQITTGEGGMIVTDDDQVADLCRSMRNQGRDAGEGWLVHERLGYNYRLDELRAALGASQMARLLEILARREQVTARYAKLLTGVAGVTVPYAAPHVRVSWFVYVIRLAPEIGRDQVMRFLSERGIDCRPYFTPIHLQPFYRETFGYREGDFPIAEAVARSTIALPFFNQITDEQMDEVVAALAEAIERSV